MNSSSVVKDNAAFGCAVTCSVMHAWHKSPFTISHVTSLRLLSSTVTPVNFVSFSNFINFGSSNDDTKKKTTKQARKIHH